MQTSRTCGEREVVVAAVTIQFPGDSIVWWLQCCPECKAPTPRPRVLRGGGGSSLDQSWGVTSAVVLTTSSQSLALPASSHPISLPLKPARIISVVPRTLTDVTNTGSGSQHSTHVISLTSPPLHRPLRKAALIATKLRFREVV